MRRRDFIAGIGGAAVWPIAALAQQRTLPLVGYLSVGTESEGAIVVSAFRRGLGEQGYVEGANIQILYRWADQQDDRLPTLAADLVRRQVAAIMCPGFPPVLAAKSTTSTIPLLFASSADPVKLGLVSSLNRPGGNVTGITLLGQELTAKRLELLHELVPAVTVVGFLFIPSSPESLAEMIEAEKAASVLGLHLIPGDASSSKGIEGVFEPIAGQQIGAILVDSATSFYVQRLQMIDLAARHGVPVIYINREMVVAGGLMSYGPNIFDAHRLAGTYVGRILKGEKPADLPVQQSTRIDMVLNLKTAKVLGIEVPTATLLRATEVIE